MLHGLQEDVPELVGQGPGLGLVEVHQRGLDRERRQAFVRRRFRPDRPAEHPGVTSAGMDAELQEAAAYVRSILPPPIIVLPPPLAAASLMAVTLARKDHWRREKLRELVARFREGAAHRGLSLLPSDTPIQPLLCGDDARAVEA